MKKIYLFAMLSLATISGFAQFTTTTYRGAFASAPEAMWTDTWTEFDPQNKVYPTLPIVTISANVTTNTTWAAGNTYALGGQIYVKDGATLTIEPGVIIASSVAGSGLFVTKGAKLIAEGTVNKPIVFTSSKTAGNRNRGDWGGVILLGKGAYNVNGGVNNIEGITASVDTQFGGALTPDDTDNSGSLKYVRIEFAGYNYGTNQEINGLTMGAVGSGTKIDYVQVSYANDDSFEWFGGAVNCSHLVAFNGLDDDFDTDNGFSGKVQFCLAIKDPKSADISDSNCFESDNNSTSAAGTKFTTCVFSNCTLVGPSYRATLPGGGSTPAARHRRGAHLRRNSQIQIFNSIFMDFVDGLVVDGLTTENNAIAGALKFNNNILAGISTTAKTLQVGSNATFNTATPPVQLTPNTATNTVGINPAFNLTTWFAAGNNTGFATPIPSEGILTKPYDTSDYSIYTGLDYRPATGSIALSGANFSTLGTDNFIASSEFSLNVYPNPSANSFKVNYFSSNNEDVKVEAYDLTGRLLESRNVKYGEINSQEIGNGYNAGVYLVMVKQANITKTVRVIKN
jgi:hypothetical protein